MIRFALFLLVLMAGSARAETLVVNLSTDLVSVTSEFTGTSIALFGVVERDAQTVSRRGKYEILVVVRGPPQDVLVQRKARRFGIWVNAEGETFRTIPSYYGVFSTAAQEAAVDEWLTLASRTHEGGGIFPTRGPAFQQALVNARSATRMWVREVGGVELLTDRFFRTVIRLPGLAEDGDYSVDVFVFANGVMLDANTMGFQVLKRGFEEQLFDLSRNRPLVYGIGVVVLALVTGYVGGVVFRRN